MKRQLQCEICSVCQPACRRESLSCAEGCRMLCSQLLSCAGIAGSHQQQLHRMTSLALAFVVLVPAVSSSCKGSGLLSPAELS